MDNLSKEYIIDFFSKKLSLFGDAPASVGWTAAGQRLRYECILSLLPLQGNSILDFGCGKGDFYGFIGQKGIEAEYTGIDINKRLIEVAAGNYPEGKFLALDIDSEELTETFDYIIDFIKEAKKHIPQVEASVVGIPEVIDIEKTKKIAEKLGVSFRIRPYYEDMYIS